MSRNEGRLDAPEVAQQDDSGIPPVTTQPTDQIFNWATPTEIVSLPSEGKFYAPDHILHGKDSVELRYMTAKEEDILTSPALLKEGVAVDRVLQNLIVDKNIKVDDLLIGDKNALVVASRINGYGAEYETSVTCPACSERSEHVFDLTEIEPFDLQKTHEEYDISFSDRYTFFVKLPMSNVVVECRFLTGKDERELFKQAQKNSRRKTSSSTMLTDQFTTFIISVNGNEDLLTIASFAQEMPARDSRFLRTAYGNAIPNLDMTQTFECSSCGYSADMEVPLTADFFWPK